MSVGVLPLGSSCLLGNQELNKWGLGSFAFSLTPGTALNLMTGLHVDEQQTLIWRV